MNKLKTNIFLKKSWGSEIIWSLTDSYIAKTIEVHPHAQTNILSHESREKSLIVVKGPLYLLYSPLDDSKIPEAYKLDEGWSWFIEPKYMYCYMAKENPVTLIEVSTADLDDGNIIVSEEHLEKEN